MTLHDDRQRETAQDLTLRLYRELNWLGHGRPRSRTLRERGWTKASDEVIALIVDMIEWMEGTNE